MNTAEPALALEERQEKREFREQKDEQGTWMLLLGIAVLMCSGLELEVLMSLDGMMRFMTVREIFWDVGVAFIPLFGIAVGWWLCLMLFIRITQVFAWKAHRRESILWRLGLAVPLFYFVLELTNSTRLRVSPHWHPGLFGWLWILPTLVVISAALICMTDLSALQRFCRIRLAPVAWVHIVLVVAIAIALVARGVHLFHDFVHPGRTVAASNLPDVYLITLDALRAQDMSVYGYERSTTPNLERFAQQAYTFDFFFANSNFTTPATTSIETGKLPWTHRVFQLGGFLRGRPQQETLAALLRQYGYYTSSIASNPFASPVQHRTQDSYDSVALVLPENGTGLWLHYTDLVGLDTLHTLLYTMLKSLGALRSCSDALIWSDRYPSPAEPVFDRVRDLIARRDIPQPRFVWIHLMPPHDPYFPPLPYRGRFLDSSKLTRSRDFLGQRNDSPQRGVSVAELRARYDENIAYADHVVGDFLEWLDRTGRLDRSIVIVSADHGESFEHNWLLHTGPYLYNGLIRIPLLIHLPGQKQGLRITQAAEQVDLLPTILDLVGGQAPSWSEGTSLKPLLEGKQLPQRLLFSMNLDPNSTFAPIEQGTVAVIDNEFKYVAQLATHEGALYRYKTDPEEEQNLVVSDAPVAARMKDFLTKKLEEINQWAVSQPR
jgi:arylsulfatase A-like enzyme